MARDRRPGRLRRVAMFVGGLAGLWLVLVFVQVTRAGDAAIDASARGDAIIVLGAAQYDGAPSPVLRGRLDEAHRLWLDGAAPLIVTTGSNQPGDRFTEGFAGFQYLRAAGVGEDEIAVVVDGGDTWESMLAAANQLPEGADRVIVVTDAYHALRSKEIAAAIGLRAAIVAAGQDLSVARRVNETIAVAAGRLLGYRRVSALR